MSAPDYAQPVTLRTSESAPVNDDRLNGIDFDLTDVERRIASMSMQRVRRQITARNREDLARSLGVELELVA